MARLLVRLKEGPANVMGVLWEQFMSLGTIAFREYAILPI